MLSDDAIARLERALWYLPHAPSAIRATAAGALGPRDLTARHFAQVDTGFAWLNIPPCLLAWGWKA